MSADLLTWQEQALCREVDAGDLFFPEKGGSSAAAQQVCRACPVQSECLLYAMEHAVDGIWGGTSVNERKELARARGRTYSTVLTSPLAGPQYSCGTEAAAARHRRRSETCDSCRVGLRSA